MELNNMKRYQCWMKSDRTGRWFWVGWYPMSHPIVKENKKYWFTSDGARFTKPSEEEN